MANQQAKTVLMATLGEYPFVVSATVNLLLHQGITLDTIQIIYPDEPDERWIGIGYELLKKYFMHHHPSITVEPVPLPFSDANSYEHSLTFLRLLQDYLEKHEQADNTVYLSLAGGRKHTSALMGLLPQFYTCVKKLYHLYDKEETNAGKQYSTQQLEKMNTDVQYRRLHVPTPQQIQRKRFTLIELPFVHITEGVALRKWFRHADEADTPPPIPISPDVETFFDDLFNPIKDTSRLELWLTQTAYNQYCELSKYDATRIRDINAYLDMMVKLAWLKSNIHDFQQDTQEQHVQEGTKEKLIHYVCRRSRNPRIERPFYYTQPFPIGMYNDKKEKAVPIRKLIITRFSHHIDAVNYDVPLRDWVQQPDIEPRYQVNDLPKRPVVLIAPLGESPMVVTQTYRLLLQEQQNVPIEAIWIIYPGDHPPASNGANMLCNVCKKRSIPLHEERLPIADVNSTETARTFAIGLMSVIKDARQRYPNASIALSISGGRKGMSAMALYAAQHQGITHVYHTTICDVDREREIDSQYQDVVSKHVTTQAEVLFLANMPMSDFDLFRVPVISLMK